MPAMQQFGGNWTTEKLEKLRKYLSAYTAILGKQKFSYAYIDAFAGTGYRELQDAGNHGNLLFPALAEAESQQFLEGSAYIALSSTPGFHRYIFIEKIAKKFAELQGNLQQKFPDKVENIIFIHGDANTVIQELCEKDWRRHRAVLFLDPFGMQVGWPTIEAIAKTRAIDLWILFPLGIGVNRMLTKNGLIDPKWKQKLDDIFGADDWYDSFYQSISQISLFGEQTAQRRKTADFSDIMTYYVGRLKTVFPHVAENPLPLYNSKNIPLFALFFAAGNPNGGKTAVKIAQHILRN